jgi:ubiquinone/menaquinone biosynthesis C-methylase UbiE
MDADKNSYVIDSRNAAEMARLMQQDRIFTRYMKGLLAEQERLTQLRDILDIACGPGGWALDLAFEHPEIEVTGIDISEQMIDYANTQAQVQVLENVKFRVMNALEPLDFADGSFDLVNARFLAGVVSPASRPALLRECMRILRPGGVIRLTEPENPITNSAAFSQFTDLLDKAFSIVGRTLAPGRTEVPNAYLYHLLREMGFQHLQYQAHAINFSANTDAHKGMYQDWMVALKLLQPFLIKVGVVTRKEVEDLYQQVLDEMQEGGFYAVWYLLTTWAEKPDGERRNQDLV